MKLEKMTPGVIAGWIAANADGQPSMLRLFVNDQALGDFRADRYRRDLEKVTGNGIGAFRIDLKFSGKSDLSNVPKDALIRLVDLETGKSLGELPISGKSDRARFQNQFGEDFTYYQKGGGFIIPLVSRTESWWKSVRQAMDVIFEQSAAAGIETQIGYGALLGHVRENGFIPHDDDIDLILHCGDQGGPVRAALEFSQRLNLVCGDGKVRSATNGQAHVHFARERHVSLDLFAAWTNGEDYYQNFTIAGNVAKADVFPSREVDFLGAKVPIPQNPDAVLSAIYGPGWTDPDPAFKWSRPKEVVEFFAPIHDYNREANKDYWNRYYDKRRNRANFHDMPPSQFAAFAVDFLDKEDQIIEFGCGTGRDSFFFSSYGWTVLAGDYSQTVINANNEHAKAPGGERARFAVCNVAEAESTRRFLDMLEPLETGKRVFYSRFFLHAISENAEKSMRQMINLYAWPGDHIVFETRIAGDENRPKVTPEHYRRFVDGNKTRAAWEKLGWTCEYMVSGTGFAKYKADDALVCRLVMKKNG